VPSQLDFSLVPFKVVFEKIKLTKYRLQHASSFLW